MINLKSIIKQIKTFFDEKKRDSYKEALGDEWNSIIFDNDMPFSKKEELYQLHKQDKYTELYMNSENIISPNYVDDYFLDLFRTREEWDNFVEYNTNPETSFHVLEGNMDESVVNIIRGITSMQVINTEESRSRIYGLNKILKHYVQEGYNFYPLLILWKKEVKIYLQYPKKMRKICLN